MGEYSTSSEREQVKVQEAKIQELWLLKAGMTCNRFCIFVVVLWYKIYVCDAARLSYVFFKKSTRSEIFVLDDLSIAE